MAVTVGLLLNMHHLTARWNYSDVLRGVSGTTATAPDFWQAGPKLARLFIC